MTPRIWHLGPPPHIGWWNASSDRGLDIWRWWSGTRFSRAAMETSSAEMAAARANEIETVMWPIEWTDYWPENARVPRIDPRPSAAARHVRDQVLASVEIRTADGVAVAPGDQVWVNGSVSVEHTTVQPVVPVTGYHLGAGLIPVARAYSTEAAARAARYKA